MEGVPKTTHLKVYFFAEMLKLKIDEDANHRCIIHIRSKKFDLKNESHKKKSAAGAKKVQHLDQPSPEVQYLDQLPLGTVPTWTRTWTAHIKKYRTWTGPFFQACTWTESTFSGKQGIPGLPPP